MAKQTSNFQAKGFRLEAQTFITADGTGLKDIAAAGADDSLITSLVISSQDAGAQEIQLWLNDGATDFLLTTISIPANAGNGAGLQAIDGLNAAFLPLSSGKRVLTLEAGWKLRAAMKAAVGGDVTATAMLQDY